MNSDDEFDPLNIGKAETISAPLIPPPKAVVIPKAPVAEIDLFAVEEKKEKKKGLKALRKTKEFLFGADSVASNLQGKAMLFGEMSRAQTDSADIFASERENFDQYIDMQSISLKFSNPTKGLVSSRVALLKRDIATVQTKIKEMKVELNLHVLKRSEVGQNRNALIVQLLSYSRQGLEDNRKKAVLLSIIQHKTARLNRIEADRMRGIISRCTQFIEWIKTIPNQYKLPPSIETDKFIQSFEKQAPIIAEIQKQIAVLEKIAKPMAPLKQGSGDWYFNVMHPQSATGKIIKRFEQRVKQLKYNDVFTIVEHLNNGGPDFEKFEQLLFDIGWQYKPYPFGIERSRALPKILDLFPAVIAKTELDIEIAFTSFNVLNGMQWPFKSAVDMIFDMTILTNPFSIARVFWDVIQETAACMKKILVVNKGINPEDVEIDFDSLFPLLEICVLVYGSDEWMTIALYTMSFNEQVSDDPQLQFAMTYLEGLVTQLMAIDVPALRAKATELKHQWLETENDPLGVHLM